MSAQATDWWQTNAEHLDPVETWRPVVGWEAYYEVSSDGRVRALPRTFTRRDGAVHRRAAHDCSLHVGDTGYLSMALSASGRRATVRVHALVAAAFIGPRPEGQVVRHLDGNQLNNAITNLAYGTPKENIYDAIAYNGNTPVARTSCIYGHPFSGANLRLRTNPRSTTGRERTCVSCAKARDWVKRQKRAGRPVTKQERINFADRVYAGLTARADA